jgi:hypothetical protein
VKGNCSVGVGGGAAPKTRRSVVLLLDAPGAENPPSKSSSSRAAVGLIVLSMGHCGSRAGVFEEGGARKKRGREAEAQAVFLPLLSGGVHRGCVKRARAQRIRVEGFGDGCVKKGGGGVGAAAAGQEKEEEARRGGRDEADAAETRERRGEREAKDDTHRRFLHH